MGKIIINNHNKTDLIKVVMFGAGYLEFLLPVLQRRKGAKENVLLLINNDVVAYWRMVDI